MTKEGMPRLIAAIQRVGLFIPIWWGKKKRGGGFLSKYPEKVC
jgi:hypothetical protein